MSEISQPSSAPLSPRRDDEGSPSPASPLEVLDVLWRRRALIACVFLSVVGSAGLWLWLRDDVYEVGTKVLIKYSRDAVNPRNAVSSSTAQFMPAIRPDLATESDLLMSLGLIEQVVEDLNLDKPRPPQPPEGIPRRIKFEIKQAIQAVKDWGNEILYAVGFKRRLTPRESAIVEIAEALTVDSAEESSVLEAKFVSQYREEAPIVLNALVDRYRERRLTFEHNPTEVEFFRGQVLEYQNRLREREVELEQVMRGRGIFSDLEEQVRKTLDFHMEAERDLRATEAERAAAEARVLRLESQLQSVQPVKTTSEVGERNELLDFLNERRSTLILEKQELLTKFQPDHAAVVGLGEQIAKTEELIGQAQAEVPKSRTTGVNPNFEELERRLLEARQESAALEALRREREERLKRLAGDLARLRRARVEYSEKKRAVALEEMTYGLHERNLEEAMAAEAITAAGATSIIVIDPAVEPIKPIGMRKLYIAGGALGVGFVLALGLALGLAALDDTVCKADEIEALAGAPVLAVIDLDRAGKRAAGRRHLERAAFELAGTAVGGDGRAATASAALIGAHPGVGASSLAAELKDALTERFGTRVVVVDFDREAPPERGLRLLSPTDPAALNGSHRLPARASERQVSETVDRLVGDEPRADLVLLDVTADPRECGTYAREAIRKSASADLRLLVVEAERTKRETIRELSREFRRADKPLHGVILNKKRPRPPSLFDHGA